MVVRPLTKRFRKREADLGMARADAADYLVALRSPMKKAVEDGRDARAAAKSFDAKPLMRLLNAPDLEPGTSSRTYLETGRE